MATTRIQPDADVIRSFLEESDPVAQHVADTIATIFAQQVADAIAAIDAARTEDELKQYKHLLEQSYPEGHPVLTRVREHWNARREQIRQSDAILARAP